MADSEESGRNQFGAVVSAQDMQDTYLPAFRAGIEQGNASGLMCSYNAETYGSGLFGSGTQGGAIPSCANKGLLTDTARGAWGFRGYVTGDCEAAVGVMKDHHYTTNALDTVVAVLGAGMDSDCGQFLNTSLMTAAYGNASIAAHADAALVRLYAVKMRLGFFDPRSSVPWAHQILH